MVKKILSLFLCVCIVLSMVVVPAYAQEKTAETVNVLTGDCVCGCGSDLADVQWFVWEDKE